MFTLTLSICTEYEPDELNPSLYSFHSDVDEKNKLLYSFSQQGIETVVDRVAKKNRIKDWIQSSIITEEEEYEVGSRPDHEECSLIYVCCSIWCHCNPRKHDKQEEDSGSSTISTNVTPQKPIPGHISSLRAAEQQQQEQQKKTSIKDASRKHIDPFTGEWILYDPALHNFAQCRALTLFSVYCKSKEHDKQQGRRTRKWGNTTFSCFMLMMLSLLLGNVQEAPSQMGNGTAGGNQKNGNSNGGGDSTATNRKFSPEKTDSFESSEHDEDASRSSVTLNSSNKHDAMTVNGRLDISIKDKRAYRERNYHWKKEQEMVNSTE